MMSDMRTTGELPILYSFRRCPYAMRARMALSCASIPVELREVALRDKPAELISVSPKATVPVLVLPDDRIIDQSYAIMKWALAHHDPDGWLDVDQETANNLVERNEGEFKLNLDRYKYPGRDADVAAIASRNAGMAFLKELDDLCSDGGFLFGERISIVDVALGPFVRQFAQVDFEWFVSSAGSALIDWLDHFTASRLFVSVMQKYRPWSTGDEITVFNPALPL